MSDAKFFLKLGLGLVAAIVAVAWLGLTLDARAKKACEGRGGEYVRVSRGSICVAPGTMR